MAGGKACGFCSSNRPNEKHTLDQLGMHTLDQSGKSMGPCPTIAQHIFCIDWRPTHTHILPLADLFEGHVVFTPLNGSANCNDFWASFCSVVGQSEPSNFVDSNGSILTPNGSISTSMAQFQLQWLNLNGSCSPHAYRIPKVSFYFFKAHSVALFWICGHKKPNLAV